MFSPDVIEPALPKAAEILHDLAADALRTAFQCIVQASFRRASGRPSCCSGRRSRSSPGVTRMAESDLRCYLTWCAERGLDSLAARRPHLELYIRWMQEISRFKPSTVSRRFSVTAGFYRTCVIDDIPEHSPAEHMRRPAVPPSLGVLAVAQMTGAAE